MKLTRRNTRRPAGFTLVELLIVIGILAMLGAGMWEARAYFETRSLKSQAQSEVATLEASLNRYMADNGGLLPFGKGDEWSSHVLYRALYCDENNDGAPDKEKGTQTMRTPYCESLAIIASTREEERERGIPVVKAKVAVSEEGARRRSGKYYLIFDPWGKPYRYRLGYEAQEERRRQGNGMNPDFDIFSLGPDSLGDGMTNTGENEDNISNVRSWD